MLPLHPLLLSTMSGLLQVNLRATTSAEELYPYDIPHWNLPKPCIFKEYWTAWGTPQNEKLSSKNWEAYNYGEISTVTIRFYITHN